MKRIIVIVIVGLCIWLMVAYPFTMLNPGELVEGHQKIKEKCQSCHEPFWGIPSEKCIACHKLSEIGKDTIGKKVSILFHSNLNNPECTSCHTDHKGIKPSVSISKFYHSFLPATKQKKCNNCHSVPSDNLHKQVSTACSNCHNAISWKSSVAFDHKMIQGTDKNNCLSCHQKPIDSFHDAFKDNCSKCHGTDKWLPSSFDHSKYFLLDQNHNANCNSCHSNNNFTAYTCYGCHEHSESKIRSEHAEEGIYNFNNCVSCHRSGNEHEIESDHGVKSKKQKKGKDENREKDDD